MSNMEYKTLKINYSDDLDAVIQDMCSKGWAVFYISQLDRRAWVTFMRPAGSITLMELERSVKEEFGPEQTLAENQ